MHTLKHKESYQEVQMQWNLNGMWLTEPAMLPVVTAATEGKEINSN